MASIRPGRCYRKMSPTAYTRTAKRVVRKAFIRGVPNLKIFHFDMGNPRKEYKYIVKIIAGENCQIRHNALESTRIVMNRKLVNGTGGKENFFFQIRTYPHHVMRENKLLSGAGADRLQTGMCHAFGKPIGKAARVPKGKAFMTVKVMNKAHADKARLAFKSIVAKLPTPCTIEIEELSGKTKKETAKTELKKPKGKTTKTKTKTTEEKN